MLQYASAEWDPVGIMEDVVLSKKDLGGPVCVKGVGDINAPPEAIIEFLKQTERRAEWDALFKEGAIIDRFGEKLFVDLL